MLERIKSLEEQNKVLNSKCADVTNDLKEDKVVRNREAQYHRTPHNIKLCGVPFQVGEEQSEEVCNAKTLETLIHVCDQAGIVVDTDDIDVCHRLGREQLSPILIRFFGKGKRGLLVNQKEKLKELNSHNLGLNTTYQPPELPEEENNGVRGRNRRGRGRGRGSRGRGRVGYTDNGRSMVGSYVEGNICSKKNIFFQEHLTKATKDLLDTTKTILKDSGFKYPGYAKNGEVRVRKIDNGPYFVVSHVSDVMKLLRNRPQNTDHNNENIPHEES